MIARSASGWRALDVDLAELESLDEVGEHLRGAGISGPVLAVVEREDDWFALIRVDEDGDPRAFVSDLEASARSQYAELLTPVGDVEPAEYAHLRVTSAVGAAAPGAGDGYAGLADGPDGDGLDADSRDDVDPLLAEAEADLMAAAIEVEIPPAWAGDPGVLQDLGVEADELVELVIAAPNDPASVVADLGERCGFDELLEALR